MESVRSFIAIELPDELKSRLSGLQARLKSGEFYRIKWVDPYAVHLTLKFLGNVAVDRLKAITGAVETAVRGISPFCLEVNELGVFPSLKRVQVVWVGIGGEIDKLNQIQQCLESSLLPLGFTAESRPFVPHLTLARLRDQSPLAERQKFGELVADTKFGAPYIFEVSRIDLMRSELTRGGAIYSRIGSVGLVKPRVKSFK